MIKYRLNKRKIEKVMERRNLSLSDLARLIGWSRQLAHYAINKGGKAFAPKIAVALGIEPGEIITASGEAMQPGADPLTASPKGVATRAGKRPAGKALSTERSG
jgi:transcriptional regulator with XRE-family HTH domain